MAGFVEDFSVAAVTVFRFPLISPEDAATLADLSEVFPDVFNSDTDIWGKCEELQTIWVVSPWSFSIKVFSQHCSQNLTIYKQYEVRDSP